MSYTPTRPCLWRDPNTGRQCVNYTTSSYCPQHEPKAVSPSTIATRSAEHRAARKRILAEGPPWPCSICGDPILEASDMEVHHVVPAGQGGQSGMANEAPAHRSCNREQTRAERQAAARDSRAERLARRTGRVF
jgi:hypothetical protein